MVILDNSTRWNSTYLSLQRALILRNRIDVYCFEYKEYLTKDTLDDGEWKQVQAIIQGLHPFYELTLQLQGNATHSKHGAIWEAIPAICLLLEHLEEGVAMYGKALPPAQSTRRQTQSQSQTSPQNPLAVAYQNAWQKLRKYYDLTDVAHGIYGAAVLLHPSHRKHFFDYRWTGDEEYYKHEMITNVKRIWETEYNHGQSIRVLATHNLPESHPPTLLDKFLRGGDIPSAADDEFDAFISGPRTNFARGDNDAVIDWLIGPENLWPGIRQQALDLLSIPAMSSELERVFSQAKLTITPQRNRLSDETVEVVELLRHWWVNNIISQQRGGGGRQQRKRKPIDVDIAMGEGEDDFI
jgi:hypothetical protein